MTRATTLRLVLPLGAALLLAGCGGAPPASLQADSTAPAAATTTPAATATTPAAAGPVAPLTGLPVSAAVAARPAIAVRLPVSGGVGLEQADLVYQEWETAGLARALAVFQSRDVAQIGPVGQVRPADPFVLPSLRPLYANVGGASGTEGLLRAAEVTQVTSAAAFTYGATGRTTSTAAVLAAAPAGAKPPPAVLPVAAAGDRFSTSHLGKAAKITVTPPGSAAETWTYSATGKRWSRAGSPGVSVANLILQTVPYKQVKLRDPDRIAQSARVLGRGACTAVSGGTVTPCTWYKRSATAVTGYVDAASVPLRFAAGPTWILLLPPGSKIATG
ncbi:MAG TPA: DUF3048 domain-containing protein [Mycobacteriales bacterium]|nr:DUF3048 domain-containing protein [Mycobacteriales bacterium]